MTYDDINSLLKINTSVKFITADNAPLIISFFYKVFKDENKFSLGEEEITSRLNDHLNSINEAERLFPKGAKEYLTDWTNKGFLRKYYETNDESLFELTPASENALKWIDDLNNPEFVGTESRLKLFVDILKDLVSKSNKNPAERIEELEREKARIEREIEDAKRGILEVLDETQIKERFINAAETAKRLLADFRQVEQNFRDIDKDFRKKIITSTNTKGKVLDELFQQQDYLWQTDQGKSFKAFWEFLMSHSKQEELETILEEVLELPAIKIMRKDNSSIARIKNNLIEAGDKVNKSTGSLIEQLRKYLEHKAFLENKLIHENITRIIKFITENQELLPDKLPFVEIDDIIKLSFMMERPLYNPPDKIKFSKSDFEVGRSYEGNKLLYEQFNVNLDDLRNYIRTELKTRSQISLKELVMLHEVEKGIAEIIGYVEIASGSRKNIFNEKIEEELLIKNIKNEKSFRIIVPQIIFAK